AFCPGDIGPRWSRTRSAGRRRLPICMSVAVFGLIDFGPKLSRALGSVGRDGFLSKIGQVLKPRQHLLRRTWLLLVDGNPDELDSCLDLEVEIVAIVLVPKQVA